jgi:hypothetical protein
VIPLIESGKVGLWTEASNPWDLIEGGISMKCRWCAGTGCYRADRGILGIPDQEREIPKRDGNVD